MSSVSFSSKSNNHKLYFSKSELIKIFNCYSTGVSNGNWKDYAINFQVNEAVFAFYKHTLASPDCILRKSTKIKRNKTFFFLDTVKKKNSKYDNLDKLITTLKRYQLSVIK